MKLHVGTVIPKFDSESNPYSESFLLAAFNAMQCITFVS
jgi:hypothetical protein